MVLTCKPFAFNLLLVASIDAFQEAVPCEQGDELFRLLDENNLGFPDLQKLLLLGPYFHYIELKLYLVLVATLDLCY